MLGQYCHVNEKLKKKKKKQLLSNDLSRVSKALRSRRLTTYLRVSLFRVLQIQRTQCQESRAAKHACCGWNIPIFLFNMLCLLNENFVGLHLQNLCLYRHATSRLRTLQDEVAKRRLKMSYLKESPNLATCILLTVKYYF